MSPPLPSAIKITAIVVALAVVAAVVVVGVWA